MTVKRDARGRVRDYTREYNRDQSSTKAKKDRAARNAARRDAERKYGKSAVAGKDVAHNTPLKFSKNPRKVGWKLQSPHKNRGVDNARCHKK